MTDKERMIELTKEAYKIYNTVCSTKLLLTSCSDDINFTFNMYYFYMKMLITIYPELNRKELETEWESEIGE